MIKRNHFNQSASDDSAKCHTSRIPTGRTQTSPRLPLGRAACKVSCRPCSVITIVSAILSCAQRLFGSIKICKNPNPFPRPQRQRRAARLPARAPLIFFCVKRLITLSKNIVVFWSSDVGTRSPSPKREAAVFAQTIYEYAQRFDSLSRPDFYRELCRILVTLADEDDARLCNDDPRPN